MKKSYFWWCMAGVGCLFWTILSIQMVGAGGETTILQPAPESTLSVNEQSTAADESTAESTSLETGTMIEDSLSEKKDTGSAAEVKADCVNVNTADAGDLVTLQGIGPVLAQRIIEFRAANGKFNQASDLVKVKGIGAGKLKKISDRICF